MTITCRPAEIHDIQGIAEVYRTSLDDLNRRQGIEYPDTKSTAPNPFYRFSIDHEPDGFWVAETGGGEIAGSAISWVRDRFWFLSHLFVLPRFQKQGVGRRLVKNLLFYESTSGATDRGVITYLHNPVSLGLYVEEGMFHRETIYRMRGKSEDVPLVEKDHGVSLDCEEVCYDRFPAAEFEMIDDALLGMTRTLHHEYLLKLPEALCLHFRSNVLSEGYAYLWPDGHIGPLAALSRRSFAEIVTYAMVRAAGRSGEITMLIPASSREIVEQALISGMRIDFSLCFMSSTSGHAWDRYCPHSPGLM